MCSPYSDSVDFVCALSRSIHSRMYAGQFLSAMPLSSLDARTVMASRSIRPTSLRSIATAPLACPSAARRTSTSSPVIRPLTCKTAAPSSVRNRSTLQVIAASLCLSFDAFPQPRRNVSCPDGVPTATASAPQVRGALHENRSGVGPVAAGRDGQTSRRNKLLKTEQKTVDWADCAPANVADFANFANFAILVFFRRA
jgi:hypothetical protein